MQYQIFYIIFLVLDVAPEVFLWTSLNLIGHSLLQELVTVLNIFHFLSVERWTPNCLEIVLKPFPNRLAATIAYAFTSWHSVNSHLKSPDLHNDITYIHTFCIRVCMHGELPDMFWALILYVLLTFLPFWCAGVWFIQSKKSRLKHPQRLNCNNRNQKISNPWGTD